MTHRPITTLGATLEFNAMLTTSAEDRTARSSAKQAIPATAKAHTTTAPEGRSSHADNTQSQWRTRTPLQHMPCQAQAVSAWRVASAGMMSVANTR